MKITHIRNYTLCIINLFAIQSAGFAQPRYENGVRVICPCELSKYINQQRINDFSQQFTVSANCGTFGELQKFSERQTISTTPERFFLFGHRKKKQKIKYPKSTNAIQF